MISGILQKGQYNTAISIIKSTCILHNSVSLVKLSEGMFPNPIILKDNQNDFLKSVLEGKSNRNHCYVVAIISNEIGE